MQRRRRLSWTLKKNVVTRSVIVKTCSDALSLTTTTETEGPEFLIQRIVPSDPSFRVTMTPALKLVEFITYLLSAVSTWTGISIMSLNPWKFLSKKKRKNKIHDQRIGPLMSRSIQSPSLGRRVVFFSRLNPSENTVT